MIGLHSVGIYYRFGVDVGRPGMGDEDYRARIGQVLEGRGIAVASKPELDAAYALVKRGMGGRYR